MIHSSNDAAVSIIVKLLTFNKQFY